MITKDPVQIEPGQKLVYRDENTRYRCLCEPDISNPFADVTTTYVVATSNSGGGCRTTDTRCSYVENKKAI